VLSTFAGMVVIALPIAAIVVLATVAGARAGRHRDHTNCVDVEGAQGDRQSRAA
jgi:hypothetical protein